MPQTNGTQCVFSARDVVVARLNLDLSKWLDTRDGSLMQR